MSVVHFATRTLTLNGVEFRAGDVVPTEGLSRHRFKQLVALRALRWETRVEPPVRASMAVSGETMAEVAVVPSKALQSVPVAKDSPFTTKRRTRKER